MVSPRRISPFWGRSKDAVAPDDNRLAIYIIDTGEGARLSVSLGEPQFGTAISVALSGDLEPAELREIHAKIGEFLDKYPPPPEE